MSKRRRLRSDSDRLELSGSEREYSGDEQGGFDDGEDGGPGAAGFSGLTEDEQDDLVQRIIRFMLCRNLRKIPVKRAELSKHALSILPDARSKAKILNEAMKRAQRELNSSLGLKIVEISRKTTSRNTASSRKTQTQSHSESSTKAYILVSNLPTKLRAENRKTWALYGFLTVIASIIVLEAECRIDQETLYRALERIGVHVKENQGHKQLNNGNVKDLLENILPRQWYLEKDKDGQETYYSIGPRLWAELDDSDILMFIKAVYEGGGNSNMGLDENAQKELRQRLVKARGEEEQEEAE